MRFPWRRLLFTTAPCLGLGGTALAQDVPRLPRTDVVAPRPPAAAPQPAPVATPPTVPAPFPTMPLPTPPSTDPGPAPTEVPPAPAPSGEGDGRLPSGSPFADFTGTLSTGVGTPTGLFNQSRSATALDSARIAERMATSTPEILQSLPGVLIQRTNVGGGSLVIRGRNGNQNLILIDGVPINDAGWRFSNVQYLNTIDPGVIDRIEVVRGPASVLYGSGAVGGVLNIITKGRKDFSQSAALGGGILTHYSTAVEGTYDRVQIQGNVQNLGFLAGGSYLGNGTLHAGQSVDFPGFTTSYEQLATDFRLDWRLRPELAMTFVYQHVFQNDVPRTDRFALPQVDPFRFDNRPTVTDQDRHFGYLRFAYADDCGKWLQGLQATLAVQRRAERERELRLAERVPTNSAGPLTPMSPRLRTTNEEVNYGSFDVRASSRLFAGNTLTYGLTYSLDSVDAARFQRQAARVGGTLNGRPVTAITPTLPPDGSYSQLGVFLFDTWALGDDLTLTAGVRWSDINAEGTARTLGTGALRSVAFDRHFVDWSAEAGFVYRLTDGLNWVGNVAEGFRAPNLEDLGANERATAVGADNGNINLNSERVVNLESGLKYRGERLVGSATYYYTHIESNIVRSLVAGTTSRANTRGLIHGVEVEGAYFLTPCWSLFFSGSQVFGQDTTRQEPLRVPPAFATFGSRWTYTLPRGGLFLEAFAEMMDKQSRLGQFDVLDIRVPPGGTSAWQTFNLRGGVDGGGLGKLTLGLYNVFDQNYRIHGSGVDAPGIDFRAGYELSF